MSFELKLAWKYFRVWRKGLAGFTALIAMTGIAAGIASLMIATALSRGFSDEMRDKILANTAHISIYANDGAELSSWLEVKKKVEDLPNVEAVTATTYESSFLINAASTNYAVLKVQPQSSGTQSGEPFEALDSTGESVELGINLAKKAELQIGDEAEIITLGNAGEPRRSKVRVRGVFQTGLFEYDSTWIYISPADFSELQGKSFFTPTILNLSVKDIYTANETAAEIRRVLGTDFKVLDWQEANRPLFAALSLERQVAFTIISLIIFISALNITATLSLFVNERRLDIAVLRACGAKTKSLIYIFLYEGLFLSSIGIFFGVLLGLLGCVSGNYFKLVSISAEVYALSYIPFRLYPENVLLIVGVAFALSLSAMIYPALKAGRLKPLENLRRQ